MADRRSAPSPLTLPNVALLLLVPALCVALGVVPGAGSLAGRLGQAAGLAALGLAIGGPALAGRLAWLDGRREIARSMKTHGLFGLLLLMLVVAHVVGVNMGGLVEGAVKNPDASWALPLGQISALVLIVAIPGAILRERLPVDYDLWRMGHRGLVVVTFLVAVHGGELGRHGSYMPFLLGFGLLLGALLVLTLWRRFGPPARGEFPYELVRVDDEAENVKSLTLRPLEAGLPDPEAGQFVMLRGTASPVPRSEHPFSLSAPAGDEGELRLTFKAVGDFTRALATAEKGATLRLDGPFGCFGADLADAPALVFIAGGVGITPLIALAKELAAAGDERPALFVRAARSRADLAFDGELEALPANWTTASVLSRPGEGWDGETGHVDEAFLRRHGEELLKTAAVCLCGPPPMMDAVTAALVRLGVTKDRIRAERFALL